MSGRAITTGTLGPGNGRLSRRRAWSFAAIVLLAGSLGCMTAKDQKEQQEELQRSIRQTSDPDSVRGCAYIMNLKPESRYGPPEKQVASLVIPKPGVSWVVLDASGVQELYSCKAAVEEPPEKAAGAAPGRAAGPPTTPPASVPVSSPPPAESRTTPAPSAVLPAPDARPAEPSAGIPSAPRVTSNPEAVHGCTFRESFTTYRSVSRFQDDVVRTGGNVGLVVSTNRDGDVIGESYSCGIESKP